MVNEYFEPRIEDLKLIRLSMIHSPFVNSRMINKIQILFLVSSHEYPQLFRIFQFEDCAIFYQCMHRYMYLRHSEHLPPAPKPKIVLNVFVIIKSGVLTFASRFDSSVSSKYCLYLSSSASEYSM